MQTLRIETIADGAPRSCSSCSGTHRVQTSFREQGSPVRHFVACGDRGISLVGLDNVATPERLLVAYR